MILLGLVVSLVFLMVFSKVANVRKFHPFFKFGKSAANLSGYHEMYHVTSELIR